jgi:hypothetical protein
LHTLIFVIELGLLVSGVLGLLSVVGFGPVAALVPDLGGIGLLLSPMVGLAILFCACQWLSPLAKSSSIVEIACLVFGALSAIVLWRRRGSLRGQVGMIRLDLIIVVGFGFLVTMLLLLPMIHTGVFTLSDFSGDELFTWAPSAAYMQTHAYASGAQPDYVSPLLWLLPTNIYPGSTGTVDGGLSALFGLHAYQFEEPFSAACLGIGTSLVYVLVRMGLRLPRGVAVVATLLAATSEFRLITAGFGFDQSARGSVLLIGGLILFVVAIREGSTGAGILAGGIAAVLLAVYMPMFLILGAAILGGLVATLLIAARRRNAETFAWKPTLAMAGGGLVFGAENLNWLLRDGGVHAWELQTSYGKALFFVKYPLQYLLGTAPLEELYRVSGVTPFSSVKPLLWGDHWIVLSVLGAVLVLLLMAAGVAYMVTHSRIFEAVCLLAPLTYGAIVFVINGGGFGGFQSVAYLTPVGSVLAACGAYGVWAAAHHGGAHTASSTDARISPRMSPYRIAVMATVVVVLALQIASSADTDAFFVDQSGMLPPTNLKLSAIASVVPRGATVLMYSSDGSSGNGTLEKTDALVAAASFLPYRNITIDGLFFTGTYAATQGPIIRASLALNYDYVLFSSEESSAEPEVPSRYHVIWSFRADKLILYKRN